MKKLTLLAILVVALSTAFVSCNSGKLKEAEARNAELMDSLRQAQAAEAELESIISDIDSGITQIKSIEGIIATPGFNSESTTQKNKIGADMQQIAMVLKQRRERIAELEAKLKKNGQFTASNKRRIEEALAKIDAQAAEIVSLQEQLKNANVKIEELNVQVEELNNTVQTVTDEKKAAEEESIRLANELNTCYYVIGSNKELKEYKIVEKKFLGKTKVLQGDVSLNYFTKSDKRKLNSIQLHSKKAKVMTNQPVDSYQITDDADGIKTLIITNPTSFWEKSNFLVIQID